MSVAIKLVEKGVTWMVGPIDRHEDAVAYMARHAREGLEMELTGYASANDAVQAPGQLYEVSVTAIYVGSLPVRAINPEQAKFVAKRWLESGCPPRFAGLSFSGWGDVGEAEWLDEDDN